SSRLPACSNPRTASPAVWGCRWPSRSSSRRAASSGTRTAKAAVPASSSSCPRPASRHTPEQSPAGACAAGEDPWEEPRTQSAVGVLAVLRERVLLRAVEERLRAVDPLERRASTRFALPSIGAVSACLALRRAAYHSNPAPAAVAATSAGWRRTKNPATRAPPLIAPS